MVQSFAFEEDATTLLSFGDGRTIRAPSAILYDFGVPNAATAQVTVSGANTPLLAARSTRKRAVVRNADATNGLLIVPAGSSAGFLLPAGQSIEVQDQLAWTASPQAGTPLAHVFEEWY